MNTTQTNGVNSVWQMRIRLIRDIYTRAHCHFGGKKTATAFEGNYGHLWSVQSLDISRSAVENKRAHCIPCPFLRP